MDVFLAILAVVALGAAATSRPAYRLRRSRFTAGLLSTGWPAVVLGFLIGPHALNLIDDEPIVATTPLLMLGLGWIGVLIGLQLKWSVLRSLPRFVTGIGIFDLAASLAVFGGLAWFGLAWWTRTAGTNAGGASFWVGVVLLACAGVGWSMETRSLRRLPDNDTEAQLAAALRAVGGLGAIFAVGAFGLGLSFVSQNAEGVTSFVVLDAAVRLVISAALAMLLGLLGRFCLTLAGDHREHQLVVFLGLVVFSAGSASQLGLSALFVSMLTGVVVANLPGGGTRSGFGAFERFILKAEHTVAVLFSLLAGVLADPRLGTPAFALIGAMLVARLTFKPVIGRALLARAHPQDNKGAANPALTPLRYGPARQSPAAVAMAVGVALTHPSVFGRELIAIVLITGLAAELAALAGASFRRREPTGDAGPAGMGDERDHLPTDAPRQGGGA